MTLKVEIDWKGKIGYGDIVSPICYAHNVAQKNTCDVDLNFYFEHPEGTKFKPEDPETINDRVKFIADNHRVTHNFQVNVKQHYEHKMSDNHTNYDDRSPLHNVGFSRTNGWHGAGDFIAVVTTFKNKKQFSEYAPGKMWKDPIGYTPGGNAWTTVLSILSKQGYRIKEVDYGTPISEASKIFQRCKFALGYHGSAMWLARWIGCPLIMFSKGKLTKGSFPWAHVEQYWSDIEITNLAGYAEESLTKRDQTIEELNEYLTIPNFYRLRS